MAIPRCPGITFDHLQHWALEAWFPRSWQWTQKPSPQVPLAPAGSLEPVCGLRVCGQQVTGQTRAASLSSPCSRLQSPGSDRCPKTRRHAGPVPARPCPQPSVAPRARGLGPHADERALPWGSLALSVRSQRVCPVSGEAEPSSSGLWRDGGGWGVGCPELRAVA